MVRMAHVYKAEHRCLAQAVKWISHMGYQEHIKLHLLVKATVINSHTYFLDIFPNKQYWDVVQ